MIIKYYGTDNILRIIEKVKDVSTSLDEFCSDVPQCTNTPNVYGILSFEEECNIPHRIREGLGGACSYTVYKSIFFTDENGYSKSLQVYGRAYICSDDGKTIEKVEVI